MLKLKEDFRGGGGKCRQEEERWKRDLKKMKEEKRKKEAFEKKAF